MLVGSPNEDAFKELASARAAIARCDQRLAGYRAALDALCDDGDPAAIARWIKEATAERTAVQQAIALGAAASPVVGVTADDVANAVRALESAAGALTTADAAGKAKLYQQLGIRSPTSPNSAWCSWTRRSTSRVRMVRVGGGT